MKRCMPIFRFFLGLFICVCSCPRGAGAQDTVMVRGEIVDLPCYMVTGGRSAAYQACALLCAKKGVPIGILSDNGELFLLLTESNNPDPYAAAKQLTGGRAELTGWMVRKHGVASLIVESAEER